MSDQFNIRPVPLMSAIGARNHGRRLKAWSEYLRSMDLELEAQRAERDSAWYLAYALSLSQTPPGAIDKEG
jgi:hypothetical protein